jgi:fermentation-respiration switch protein FrsA (DUF1100 family)
VLLIHGDNDRNVRFSETVDLARRLALAGVPYEELIVPDDTHHFMRHANLNNAPLCPEQLEVTFARHPGGAEQVLDDENGNRSICGDHEGAFDPAFRVDQVVTALSDERKSLVLEDAHQLLMGDRSDLR